MTTVIGPIPNRIIVKLGGDRTIKITKGDIKRSAAKTKGPSKVLAKDWF
jgi:hypothetical protein